MIKYLLVDIYVFNQGGYDSVTVVNDYDDVVTAEKARLGYLVVYPEKEVQNVQVIQVKEQDANEIPF